MYSTTQHWVCEGEGYSLDSDKATLNNLSSQPWKIQLPGCYWFKKKHKSNVLAMDLCAWNPAVNTFYRRTKKVRGKIAPLLAYLPTSSSSGSALYFLTGHKAQWLHPPPHRANSLAFWSNVLPFSRVTLWEEHLDYCVWFPCLPFTGLGKSTWLLWSLAFSIKCR